MNRDAERLAHQLRGDVFGLHGGTQRCARGTQTDPAASSRRIVPISGGAHDRQIAGRGEVEVPRVDMRRGHGQHIQDLAVPHIDERHTGRVLLSPSTRPPVRDHERRSIRRELAVVRRQAMGREVAQRLERLSVPHGDVATAPVAEIRLGAVQ